MPSSTRSSASGAVSTRMNAPSSTAGVVAWRRPARTDDHERRGAFPPPIIGHAARPRVLVVVETLDDTTIATLAYARAIETDRLHAVHVVTSSAHAARLRDHWDSAVSPAVPLLCVDLVNDSLVESLSPVVNSELPDAQHPVIVMIPDSRSLLSSLWRRSQRESRASCATSPRSTTSASCGWPASPPEPRRVAGSRPAGSES